jgi:predicted amidophosphoribosyltransferase
MLQAPDGHLSTVEYLGLFEHVGDVREAILQLKYQEKRNVAAILATRVVDELPAGEKCDVVTWAPTTSQRRQTRGFDQSELIARHLAAHLGVRHARLLRRDNKGRQTGSGRNERLAQPSFVARPRLRDQSVYVIDDVMTTGATLRAAAEALVAAGASQVRCIAVSWVK